MQGSFTDLTQFINDFKLKQPNGISCFNSRLEFHINSGTRVKESEVHIITSDHLATIYFLGPAENVDGLPDMFDIKNSSFTYVDKQYLKIESNGITVLVFPIFLPPPA